MIALILGILFGIAHYLSEAVCNKFSKHRDILISFIAGISVSYVFVELFPGLFHENPAFREVIFLFVLLGFFIFYVFEKYIYKHAKSKLIVKDLANLHSVAFFIYHFVIGLVLVDLISNKKEWLLLFIPVFLYSLVGEISLNEVHEHIKNKWYWRLLLALSTVFGVLTAYIINISMAFDLILLGFVAGALIYIVVRESIPKERSGNLLALSSGVVLYTFLIFLLKVI